MHSSVTIVGVLIGFAILFFGRGLFWLCVAAVGFAVGVEIAPLLVNEPSSLLALVIALVFGVLGALLAIFLQKVAIAVLGFLAGGKLATAIAASFFVHYAQYSTIIFVIGGIIGAILLLAVFGWALIVVSSFIGAYLLQSSDELTKNCIARRERFLRHFCNWASPAVDQPSPSHRRNANDPNGRKLDRPDRRRHSLRVAVATLVSVRRVNIRSPLFGIPDSSFRKPVPRNIDVGSIEFRD